MYATGEDMIDRFGETEMVRLTVVDGALDDQVDLQKVDRALTDASSVVDGFLRARYAVPVAAPVPAELVRAVCILARHDLAHGGDRAPTEQMDKARDGIVRWLRDVAEATVLLDLPPAPASGPGPEAMVQDRAPMFTGGRLYG